MKDIILTCTAVSVVTSLVRIILDSASHMGVSKFLQIALDIFLLIALFGAFFGLDFSGYGSINFSTEDFAAIESSTVAEIKTQAEKMLSERIGEALEKEFSKKPLRCVSVIDVESLEICKLYVYFDTHLISGYDVKRFLKEKYNVDAEVMFE